MNFKYELISPQLEGFFYEKNFLKLFFSEEKLKGFNLPITKVSKVLTLTGEAKEKERKRRKEEGAEVYSFCLFRELPAEIIEIDYIVTQRAFLRKGYSKSLINELVNEYSPKEIWLEVSELNVGAICFYERLGFKRKSMRKDYYNKGEAAFLYSLTLQKD